jgi:Tol biopolymer transport system component
VVYPYRNIYRRDLHTGVTTLVSVNATGFWAGNSSSYFPKFSPDGTKILFYSYARDLLTTGDPGNAGLYVRDLVAGRTSLVSLRSDGTAANLTYGTGTFDPTGTKIAYTSLDTQHGLPDTNYGGDVVVFDMTTRRTSLVSVNTTRTATGNDGSGGEMFALGGQQVVFQSEATDLVAKDTNGTHDLFIGAPLPPPAGQP